MCMHIETTFDNDINAFIVRMPDHIALEELNRWRKEFLQSLGEGAGDDKAGLLLDTNKHQFESIECLKLLRDLLSSERQIEHCIGRVAFVQPGHYREPELSSSTEAYFSRFEDAYHWLREGLHKGSALEK